MRNKADKSPMAPGWLAAGLFAFVLVIMFWRSFHPDYVFFNNDGPLGVQNTAWVKMPNGITGIWTDLNYLGGSGGAYTPGVTAMLHVLMSPLLYAKFYQIVVLFILALSVWTLCRQLKLSALASTLAGLAAMLNSTFFSSACWGVGTQEIALGLDSFALALIVSCTPDLPAAVRWMRIALAGMCVGVNVMEAADIGALYSILIAIFVLFQALSETNGTFVRKAVRGVVRVAVVAGFAGFIAYQAVISLVGIGIQGVAGSAQDTETKTAHWDWATQWSLPKAETFGLFIPGLFGYKMDTPKDMQPSLQDAYRSGVYWGGMGRDPAIDRYFDSGSQGSQPPGYMRFTGGGNYCGVLVFLVAGWAIAQAFRRQNSVFTDTQKRMIKFWAAVMLFCLLFAWGRFSLFYAILYHLPYFSTIRNPAKFLNFFSWALVIVFAFGIHGLGRRYFDAAATQGASLNVQLKIWWAKANNFDRKWTFATVGLLIASVLGWLLYLAQKPALIQYLQKVGFGDNNPASEISAPAIAAFSLGQAAWFVVLFAVAVGLLLATLSGYFNGPRAKLGMILLGGFLLFDMGRANLPWLVNWDYKQKYEVGSLNPIVSFLTQKPYEHRVAMLPFEPQQQLRDYDYLFGGSGLYRIEWMQHHFPYYNVQSLDIVQMPRMPEDMKAYKEALAPSADPATYPKIAREWQLTNTRYLLGAAGFLQVLNQELDPKQNRFQIVQRFDVEPKPGISRPVRLEELTAVKSNDGDLALFEFTGALPRAKLYRDWQVNTNDAANLKLLGDLNFDPLKTVLVSTPQNGLPGAATNENTGSVDFVDYQTKHIVLSAQASGPSVLLLNDKFDPAWRVSVDGKPAELLRCNFMMRGVFLPTAGTHTVEFDFSLPHGPLCVTLTAMAIGIVMCGFLAFAARKRQTVSS